MKVSKDFMLREIAGETLVIPVNEAAVHFQGIMSLNESGKLLWDRLQEDATEDDLIVALLDVYDTTAICFPRFAETQVGSGKMTG